MPSASPPKRPLSTTLALIALWFAFYASFTLFTPALLDDADSVHAEVAREMLLRHDWVTLYANGIRYLEKAPLLYWSMALSMRIAQLLGHASPQCLAVAARIPLALTILALALAVEVFARRAFRSSRAGLYAALILLSSPGIFLFTRITIPDAMLCLWLTLAMLAFWLSESSAPNTRHLANLEPRNLRLLCYAFAACCAFGVLTKGLIGLVFPHRHRRNLPAPDPRPARRPRPHRPTPPHHQRRSLPSHRRALAHPHRPRQPNPGQPRKPRLHQRPLASPPANRWQRPRLGLVLLRQRTTPPLSQPPRPPRLRHRPALPLLGSHPHLANALVRLHL